MMRCKLYHSHPPPLPLRPKPTSWRASRRKSDVFGVLVVVGGVGGTVAVVGVSAVVAGGSNCVVSVMSAVSPARTPLTLRSICCWRCTASRKSCVRFIGWCGVVWWCGSCGSG